MLQVPDVRQSTNYTCGAAALQSVLAYWGIEYREDRLVEKLGSTPDAGTPPQAIMKLSRELGLKAQLKEQLSLADLESYVKSGVPVIVACQAWRDEDSAEWSKEWQCGHYMVVIGIDPEKVYFEDPSLLGSRGYIGREEFLKRWHDVDGGGRRYERLGIVIEGARPSPPPDLAPVE